MDEPKRDIEEPEAILESSELDPLDFWKAKQRELVTSVVDYNLITLSGLVTEGTISLAPQFQRRFRWDQIRQSKLIESFLMNVPIPPIFLNEDEYGAYSVIDGKQRLSTIVDFFRGKLRLEGLEIFQDINGMSIDDLTPTLRRVLETRPTLRAVIILRQSDRDIKFEVFRRLNTGGVRLNAQEVRNSAFPGPLNDLIMTLSENASFHRLLGIRTKRRSAIWQEMRDAEFVLRYFTFKDNWREFKGGMKRQMDRFMEDNREASQQTLSSMETQFLSTIAALDAAFGDHAFQRWVPSRGAWRRQVLAALYDAEMFAAHGLEPRLLHGSEPRVLAAMELLFSDADFIRSIEVATNTPASFRLRIDKVKAILEHSIEQ